ncbi:MAG: iron ABC transporter permease [Cyclobacteriaceae bacterium]|nr:iron ABC transporter permease [Cyclobacteriaceae bacterium]
MSLRTGLLLITSLFVLFVLDLTLGSVYIPPDEVFSILMGGTTDHTSWRQIILDFRMPRAVTAVVVGGGLAVSGLEMQSLFRNPLAGPYVLGISTGASLGVAITVMTGISVGLSWLSPWFTALSATLGAALVFLLVIAVAGRVKDSMTLLIFGLMFGAAAGAIVSVLQFFSQAEDIQVYLLWTFGNLGGMTWDELSILIPTVMAGWLLAFLLAKSLNALLLGENYAASMGIHLRRSRYGIIISASLLTGCITAFCGPIGFIGIAVPHLVRMISPSSNHRSMLPAVTLAGAIILLACDIISQLPGSQHVLPINAVTALVGAPVVIWIVIRRRNVKGVWS